MPATFGTIVNPTKKLVNYLETHASNQLAKSLIAVSTPQYAGQLQHLHSAFPRLQVVSFACDSVPLGCQRSGFSWLLTETSLKVKDRYPLVPDTSRNWSGSTAAVRITSSKTVTDLGIPAANTLFSTGNVAEIYAENGEPLSALHIDIDLPLVSKQVIRPATQLSGWLEITAATDNMLKTLDNQRAAQTLEKHPALQQAIDPQVFAQLQSSGEFVRVVAGGGGLWSPRASMLVLEAPCQLKRGDRLQFWVQSPKLNSDLESQLASTPENGVVAEVAPVPQTTADEKPLLDFKRDHYIPVFGFGSELGFMVDGHKHSIVGESIYFN